MSILVVRLVDVEKVLRTSHLTMSILSIQLVEILFRLSIFQTVLRISFVTMNILVVRLVDVEIEIPFSLSIF
jgi:hypothetical protein